MNFIRTVNGFEKAKETDLTSKEVVVQAFVGALVQFFDYDLSKLNELPFYLQEQLVNPNALRGHPLTYYRHIDSVLKRAGYSTFKPADLMLPNKARTIAAFNALDGLNRNQVALRAEAQLVASKKREQLEKELVTSNKSVDVLGKKIAQLNEAVAIMDSANYSEDKFKFELRQLDLEIENVREGIKDADTEIQQLIKLSKDMAELSAGLKAKWAEAKSYIAFLEKNQQLATSIQEARERLFQLDAALLERKHLMGIFDDQKRGMIKEVDKLSFREITVRNGAHESLQEARATRESSNAVHREIAELQQFAKSFAAVVKEKGDVLQFVGQCFKDLQ